MPDARQFRFHLGRGDDMTIGEVAEIELHARLKTPVERHFVDGDRPAPAVHGRGVMPGRVEMSAAMGGHLDHLDGPALAIGQIGGFETRKILAHASRRRGMGEILDSRLKSGRIGGDARAQRR